MDSRVTPSDAEHVQPDLVIHRGQRIVLRKPWGHDIDVERHRRGFGPWKFVARCTCGWSQGSPMEEGLVLAVEHHLRSQGCEP